MPDPYEVKLTKRAHKELAALDRVTQQRIDKRLLKLAEEPFPPDAEKLSGIDEDWYRVRVGDDRIIYDVDEGRLIVLVIRIGHRREVYRRIR
ncbi:MAG: type II toxin-antitoxin system RelE/ParE family toxin [Acidobacteria bacterium]|nr:MAG: type II toxin-antitoxin system RelE/ParE family toxin [Acidobacteriota bacterium]